MTLDVDKEKMTIMGVQFENFEDFDAVWYVIGSFAIDELSSTKADVQRLKERAIAKRQEIVHG